MNDQFKLITDIYLRQSSKLAMKLMLRNSHFNALPGFILSQQKNYSIHTDSLIYYRGISGAIYYLS